MAAPQEEHSSSSPALSAQEISQRVSKGFSHSTAQNTCRLLYPVRTRPDDLSQLGTPGQGHDPVLGAYDTLDIPARTLAGVGLADSLAQSVALGHVDEAQAQQWLRDTTGGDFHILAPLPVLPSTSYQVASALPMEVNAALWSDAGPMAGTPWVELGNAANSVSTPDAPGAPGAGLVRSLSQEPLARQAREQAAVHGGDAIEQGQRVQRLQDVARTTPSATAEPVLPTHEARVTPYPGGMSFEEARRRRDEPEDISPRSLQSVHRLNVPDRLPRLDRQGRLMKHRYATALRSAGTLLSGIRPFALVCALVASACATTLPPPSPKENPVMSTESAQESSSTALSVQEVSKRVLTLIENIRSRQDLSPETIERYMGRKVWINPDKKSDFQLNGKLTEEWYYSLSSMPPLRPDEELESLQLEFSAPKTPHVTDMSPICVPLEVFSAPLVAAGFTAQQLGARFHDLWVFSRDAIYASVYLRGKSDLQDTQTCVHMVTIGAKS